MTLFYTTVMRPGYISFFIFYFLFFIFYFILADEN